MALIGPDMAGQGQSIHDRHVEIGQHDIRPRLVERVQSALPILGQRHLDPRLFEGCTHQFAHGGGIINGQNAHLEWLPGQ